MFNERTLQRRIIKIWGRSVVDQSHSFRFNPGADTSCPFFPHETEDEQHVLCKCTTNNNIRPDLLRRDGLRGGVSYHSVMETTNQCRLQQTALFLIKAGKMIWNSRGNVFMFFVKEAKA